MAIVPIVLRKLTFTYRTHLCGYDLNLTYPQDGHFPPLMDPTIGLSPEAPIRKPPATSSTASLQNILATINTNSQSLDKREVVAREEKRQIWKRSLSGRANGTIDPWYGCFLLFEVADYAMNFSAPWSMSFILCNSFSN